MAISDERLLFQEIFDLESMSTAVNSTSNNMFVMSGMFNRVAKEPASELKAMNLLQSSSDRGCLSILDSFLPASKTAEKIAFGNDHDFKLLEDAA